MNMFSLKVCRIITIMTIAFLSFSYGADLKIVHMDGVFDLDNDDLVEFITIEEGKGDGGVTGKVGYYEIDELGYPQLLLASLLQIYSIQAGRRGSLSDYGSTGGCCNHRP